MKTREALGQNTRIVVIGGGYAGTMAANRSVSGPAFRDYKNQFFATVLELSDDPGCWPDEDFESP